MGNVFGGSRTIDEWRSEGPVLRTKKYTRQINDKVSENIDLSDGMEYIGIDTSAGSYMGNVINYAFIHSIVSKCNIPFDIDLYNISPSSETGSITAVYQDHEHIVTDSCTTVNGRLITDYSCYSVPAEEVREYLSSGIMVCMAIRVTSSSDIRETSNTDPLDSNVTVHDTMPCVVVVAVGFQGDTVKVKLGDMSDAYVSMEYISNNCAESCVMDCELEGDHSYNTHSCEQETHNEETSKRLAPLPRKKKKGRARKLQKQLEEQRAKMEQEKKEKEDIRNDIKKDFHFINDSASSDSDSVA